MLRILKSPEAENDLDEIWLYIAQDNPGCADKLLDEIEETSRNSHDSRIRGETGMNYI